jgi:hypothetical protein
MDNESIILKIQEMQMQIKSLENNSKSGGLSSSEASKLSKEIEVLRAMVLALKPNESKQITSKDVEELINKKVTQLYISNLYRTK